MALGWPVSKVGQCPLPSPLMNQACGHGLKDLRAAALPIRAIMSHAYLWTVLSLPWACPTEGLPSPPDSSNVGNGNRQPPDHGGGPGSKEHREAGPLPSDT